MQKLEFGHTFLQHYRPYGFPFRIPNACCAMAIRRAYPPPLHRSKSSCSLLMAQGPEEPKHWEGSVSAELPHATADEAWLLASDFFSIHKWLPGVETCHKLDGAEGIVRCCAGPAAEDGNPKYWAMERLLEMNELEHSYSYEITESNMGFGRYVARMKVVPASSGEHGCKLTWSFEADPVQGWTQIGLLAYLQTSLETMARRIEEALTSTD